MGFKIKIKKPKISSFVPKAVSSVASKAVQTVGNVTAPATNAVGKIASGNVAEGLGDLGQTGARMGLDIATGGNRNLVDGYSGGLLTSAENAARGNTKDITRLGATGGAAFAGGPAAAFAVNQAFAGGGGIAEAGMAYAGSEKNMDLKSGLFDLGKNLATTYVSNLNNKPAKLPSPAPVIQVPAAPVEQKKDNTLLYAGLGVGVGLLVLIVVMKGK